jgi:hypothetical protein
MSKARPCTNSFGGSGSSGLASVFASADPFISQEPHVIKRDETH